MTKGLPASGKSTWAKSRTDAIRVNKDDLRQMLHAGKWSKENEKVVLKTRDLLVELYLAEGMTVIVDDTNLDPKHETDLRAMAEVCGAEFEIQDFTNVPLSRCLDLDSKRAASVGRKVILGMYERYLKPKPAEYKFAKGKPGCVICDIDGTIAQHVNRSPYEWDKVGDDQPISTVIDILDHLKETYAIIMVSGRDGSCEQETRDWLQSHAVPYTALYMRPAGNTEKDAIIKERIFAEKIDPMFNVHLVLDDRDQVVEMWRSKGLRCLQVDYGNF